MFLWCARPTKRAPCAPISRGCWWDKPESILEDRLIINHFCTAVQHSDAFQHLSFLGKVDFFLPVFHNLWLACCFKEKEAAKYHCVLQIFVWSTGQCCCGWIPSVMFKHSRTCFMFYTVLFKCCAFILLFNRSNVAVIQGNEMSSGSFCWFLLSCSNWAATAFGTHYIT